MILNQPNLPVKFHVKYTQFDLRLIVFLGLLAHAPNRSPILLDIAKTKFKNNIIAFVLVKCIKLKYIHIFALKSCSIIS